MNTADITAEDLIALVRAYNPKTNENHIRLAYEYGQQMHDGQFRHSGEPYFTHPVSVAAILTEQQLDDATIITALLHDTIEDTKASYRSVDEKFGRDVAELVDGVTKLTNLQLNSNETKQAENFRKLFMAMSKDLRVILVKLADRLHNMRTIKSMRPDKQIQKARETMDIYAPLAGRMGMQWMREELEDLAFRVLNPEGRQSIIRRFITLQRETGDVIQRITGDMRHELEKAGIEAEVFGRAKKPYSIWRKMQEKQQSFSRLSDIYGFRVITTSEDECYRALGTIHRRWRAVPGRFKDYISQPKTNGYRSIHTTVSGRDGKRVEVQIRTRQMHDVAESGVAAHWSYRDGVRSRNPFAVDPVKWVAQLTEQLDSEEDHEDFLEAVKLEMYADQVFCFTPKGEVVKLPRGATPIDFAYAIHTRIGAACVGAKIDGMRVPLWTRVKNGQSIEIITAQGQTPQATWLDIATTGKAKTAIRRSLRELDRARFVSLGRELARSAFEQMNKSATEKVLRTAARNLRLSNEEELLAQLGSAELSGQEVVQAVYPNLRPKPGEHVDRKRAVVGLEAGQSFDRSPCCQALPGERIVGITFRGQGVKIHTIDCERLSHYEDQPERWLDLRWHDGPHPAIYGATLELTIGNGAGVLGRICTLIGQSSANIADLEFLDRKPDFFRLLIYVELRDIAHLHSLIPMLEAESEVAEISRYRNPDLFKAGSKDA
ncbi:MAG: bifunctional (p)ppGpp synthetase/guanosine-3',5'-bis(diphosphate) 3'-pyrophosphohydrolase [Sulfitobacter litoralis]|jgi:guanosine-3',5'-bis(diphosphate) 3'-pyrophosphohydrolase|uniref:GTP pyrophosphokinase rsh n=2 Tax=root TaxID=1 RepID=A0A7V1BIH2_9RHOB|nr:MULTISPECIES: bifunctional (p)ppGpp synthetase/guanosine-3',5'-bis(diphosphate) 3'-pyrophosphohydrolase [Sulfitobacter]MBQ0717195.1 bifunctional (p)ppGpp synthetase/guanosine-3',5'-bis(diphosphate) 3'-pyrophosphohydrolase [Sulfitobacter litoralis]MBQ0764978.1 bifunctional (p)ppGpp synthetase/guanosine-3',5'-bis(diphosphate) 3'-pyrophosphohydrolase [Sulfitobacter litoralis]MBQ0800362.1 bifunctional (p)ppGpp synthetase/guanosine-3',5'-bis(diphosphate) 3'-pyrophosphohydrolase [Sulfitobacter lito|tara:strand:- start:1819 stop:3969 length:2151 start_codon:yes stop_codon:yes gene_type:complete